MKDKIKGVDMDAVMDYMIRHDCRLDEAIEAVSGQEAVSRETVNEKLANEAVSKTETPTPQLVPKRNKLSDRMSDRTVKESFTVEKPRTKLKSARIVAGLSQSALAERTGLKLRTLQAYEQGHKSLDNASFGTVVKIAEACGCKLEHLIDDPELLDLLRNYKNLL